jgi:hypothetical protein
VWSSASRSVRYQAGRLGQKTPAGKLGFISFEANEFGIIADNDHECSFP